MEGTNPVNKKLVAALSGGAALVLALTGCSEDNSKKLNNWAKTFCAPHRSSMSLMNVAPWIVMRGDIQIGQKVRTGTRFARAASALRWAS